MSTDTLFGPAPEPRPRLSADQRLTKRNADLLAKGKHPATLLPLLGSGNGSGGSLSLSTQVVALCAPAAPFAAAAKRRRG